MLHRVKEEERIERAIRGLLKLAENRRCLNCDSLGPQYVCTTFWTFVCTNCSGIHREFTHRVKSVSMAKFTADEVSSLQAGGNERARQIYFKTWDPRRDSFPDSCNLHRLRDFIKHIYVDRKYTSERGTEKPAMFKRGFKGRDLSSERHSFERSYQGKSDDFDARPSFEGSLAPKQEYRDDRSFERLGLGSREEFFECRSSDRHFPNRGSRYYVDGRRSPQSRQKNAKPGGHRSRMPSFEIVDDRFREDGYGRVKRFENCRLSNRASSTGSLSPNPQKNRELVNTRTVCSATNMIENSPPLKVGESPKANGRKSTDGYIQGQKAVCSQDPPPVEVKNAENRTATLSSLIDFVSELEPSDSAKVPEIQATAPSSNDGVFSVPASTTDRTPNAAPKIYSLESLLSALSGPADEQASSISEISGSIEAPSSTSVALSNGTNDESTPPASNGLVAFSNGGAPAACSTRSAQVLHGTGGGSMVEVIDGLQLPMTQQNQVSAAPFVDSNSSSQQGPPAFQAFFDQPWPSATPNTEVSSSSVSSEQQQPQAQAFSKPAEASGSGDGSKSSGRKELPLELFQSSFSAYPASAPGWQFHPLQGMGCNMQYQSTAMPISSFPSAVKSTNPFDLNQDSTRVLAPKVSTTSSLPGTLPHASNPGGIQPQVSPYESAMPHPQSTPYGMSMSLGACTGQQLPNNMPAAYGLQQSNTFGSGEPASASNQMQQHQYYSAPNAPNSFPSAGGNPFG